MMKTGLCHICGRPAKNTCTLCGRPVCDNDFDFSKGVCKMHGSGRKAGSGVRR